MTDLAVAMLIDSGPEAGLGHLSRCRSLAFALRKHGTPVTAFTDHHLAPAIAAWGADFDEVTPIADESERVAVAAQFPVIILDSYRTAAELLPRSSLRVVIDDGPPRALDADLVVNPNLGATGEGYEGTPLVLTGSLYALVRPEVQDASLRLTTEPIARQRPRVLVTCGGVDPVAMTERFMDAIGLLGTAAADVRIVVGPGNRRSEAIAAQAIRRDWVIVVGAADLTEHEAWATVALTTVGTTAIELACLGVPNLAVAIDRRQLPHLATYAALGIAWDLGWHATITAADIASHLHRLLSDPSAAAAMRDAGRAAVDGRGADRVAEATTSLAAK